MGIKIDTQGALGFIAIWPSGIVYTNQTGGVACRHPEQEGVFFPLGYRGDELENGFVSCGEAPSEKIADDIDAWFKKRNIRASVDRSRLAESQEAWVYVDIAPGPAVLVWQNSD